MNIIVSFCFFWKTKSKKEKNLTLKLKNKNVLLLLEAKGLSHIFWITFIAVRVLIVIDVEGLWWNIDALLLLQKLKSYESSWNQYIRHSIKIDLLFNIFQTQCKKITANLKFLKVFSIFSRSLEIKIFVFIFS